MPEKFTTATIWLAGIIEIAEAELESSPKLVARMSDIGLNDWLGFVPFGLLVLGFGAHLIHKWKLARNPISTRPVVVSTVHEIKPLLDAFERFAADEHGMATACGLPPHGSASSLTQDEIGQYVKEIKDLDVVCADLRLDATRDAIKHALGYMKPGVTRLDAYHQFFRHVSSVFREEAGRETRLQRVQRGAA